MILLTNQYINQLGKVYQAYRDFGLCITPESILNLLNPYTLLGFIAGGVVANTLSQFLYHYYIRYRFKKDIALVSISTEFEIQQKLPLFVFARISLSTKMISTFCFFYLIGCV